MNKYLRCVSIMGEVDLWDEEKKNVEVVGG